MKRVSVSFTSNLLAYYCLGLFRGAEKAGQISVNIPIEDIYRLELTTDPTPTLISRLKADAEPTLGRFGLEALTVYNEERTQVTGILVQKKPVPSR